MRIGELCRRTGYSKDTIRFYEKIDLLPAERQGWGFKANTNWHVLRLLHTKYAKAAKFTLGQMGEMPTDWVSGNLSDAEKRSLLADQIQKINTTIADLRQVRACLHQNMALCVEAFAEEAVAERAMMS